MKTNQKSSKKKTGRLPRPGRSGDARNKAPAEITNSDKDELVVIRDASNRKEYYLSIVDTFVLNKREYVVMYNYVPDDGNHENPELVIMRTEFAAKGDQYFYSIKDPGELELAFTCFMRRYYSSSVPDKQARRGVDPGTDGGVR